MGKRARRIDENQPLLVEYIRRCGATWQSTHELPGALDGIVGYLGIDQRVEIKNPNQEPSKRKLTKDEEKVFDEWKGRPPVIMETVEDVQNLLKQMRWEYDHCRELIQQ